MRRLAWIGFGLLVTALMPVSRPATAQGLALPAWKISDICAKESAPGQCAAFEGRALKSISASWPFLLDAIKTACLTQLANPAGQSWRELADCVDNASIQAVDKAAVMTARTPAEPVPPARAAVPAAPSPDPAPAAEPPAQSKQ